MQETGVKRSHDVRLYVSTQTRALLMCVSLCKLSGVYTLFFISQTQNICAWRIKG